MTGWQCTASSGLMHLSAAAMLLVQDCMLRSCDEGLCLAESMSWRFWPQTLLMKSKYNVCEPSFRDSSRHAFSRKECYASSQALLHTSSPKQHGT